MTGWTMQGRKSGHGSEPALPSPRVVTRLRTVAAATLCAGLLAACASDSDSEPAPADAADSPIAAESAGAEDVSADAGDEAGGDAGNDSSSGGASGTAQWQGESFEYDSVKCQDQSDFGKFTMIANGPDAPTLSVGIEFNPLEEPDYSQPARVELFFGEPGGTIGESEGYVESSRPVEGATSSMEGASGSVQLEADDSTMAPDINPDGGQLDFEISCG